MSPSSDGVLVLTDVGRGLSSSSLVFTVNLCDGGASAALTSGAGWDCRSSAVMIQKSSCSGAGLWGTSLRPREWTNDFFVELRKEPRRPFANLDWIRGFGDDVVCQASPISMDLQ